MTPLQIRSAAARKGARTRKRLAELRHLEMASRETCLGACTGPVPKRNTEATGPVARATTSSVNSPS